MTRARMAFLFLSTAIPAAALAGGPQQDGNQPPDASQSRRYEDSARRFHLTVPLGWSAVGHQHSVMHYRDVFLCINSTGNKALRVINKRDGDTETYSAETVAEQLEPGTVYIDLAHFDGPATSYAGMPDTVEEDLTAVLKDAKFRESAGGKLSEARFAFIKNGHRWSVFVFCRQPVDEAARTQALEVLRSLRFAAAEKK